MVLVALPNTTCHRTNHVPGNCSPVYNFAFTWTETRRRSCSALFGRKRKKFSGVAHFCAFRKSGAFSERCNCKPAQSDLETITSKPNRGPT